MDIPLLRTSDAGYGAYVAGGPFGDGDFPGQEIFRGLDGVNYGPFAFISSTRAVDHGFAIAALADADDGFWDRDSTIQITMSRGVLVSSTEAAVIATGANGLLIGKELVNFVTAVDDGNNNFTISTLLRGRKGTEQETALHVINEKVVVIDASTLLRKGMDLTDVGDAFFYKGVTRGGTLSEAIRKVRTVDGRSEWTWAPVHVTGSITADTWTVLWVWRNFLSPEWKNLVGTPQPTSFKYEVDVLSGPAGTGLKTYTETVTANGSVITASLHRFVYDDDDQILDFGSVQTTVTFKIYPLVDNIGRGFPKEVTLAA